MFTRQLHRFTLFRECHWNFHHCLKDRSEIGPLKCSSHSFCEMAFWNLWDYARWLWIACNCPTTTNQISCVFRMDQTVREVTFLSVEFTTKRTQQFAVGCLACLSCSVLKPMDIKHTAGENDSNMNFGNWKHLVIHVQRMIWLSFN